MCGKNETGQRYTARAYGHCQNWDGLLRILRHEGHAHLAYLGVWRLENNKEHAFNIWFPISVMVLDVYLHRVDLPSAWKNNNKKWPIKLGRVHVHMSLNLAAPLLIFNGVQYPVLYTSCPPQSDDIPCTRDMVNNFDPWVAFELTPFPSENVIDYTFSTN